MASRTSTYRLQLTPQFGFEAAAALVPYLQQLGISHLYTSPYLQAAHGSTHGYDVVDPQQVNQELGGKGARQELIAALKEHGLKQLIDIVPNHMAIRGGHNAWWWDVLENGPASRYSRYFDVEWEQGKDDKILLPILGDQYGVELEAGRIAVAREGCRYLIKYFDHEMPVAPRALSPLLRSAAERNQSDQLAFLADAFAALPPPSSLDRESRTRRHRGKEALIGWLDTLLSNSPELRNDVDTVIGMLNADTEQLHSLLEAQNYRLAYWRVGNHELAYRRFFDIDSLIGLRVEDDEVFEATHRLILEWIDDGSIDGLRIDHVDGLFDPEAYLRRIRAIAPNCWVLVEKILEGEERLSPGWPVDGTTGYDFLNHVQRVFADERGEPQLSLLHEQLSSRPASYEEQVRTCKKLVLKETLDSDVERLVERLSQIIQHHRRHRDTARVELAEALRELLIVWPVYRTYTAPGEREIAERDRTIVEQACASARDQRGDLDPRLFDLLKRLLLLEYRDDDSVEFVMRFQQLSGPAMAKGLEDTMFYRHHRLVALNEVGGDPNHFSEDIDEFHSFAAERARVSPFALNASSTHDTKRSEDVRARLLVLSEIPEEWAVTFRKIQTALKNRQVELKNDQDKPFAAPGDETIHFIFQNIVGAWPISQDRVQEFGLKAVREGKKYSSWHRPNAAFEEALGGYIAAFYASEELLTVVEDFVSQIRDAGYCNSLSQLLLKMLSPGVPDIYQGTELWDFSLVDPDNRRPVDFEERKRLLSRLEQGSLEALWEERASGAIKLAITTRLLKLRQEHLEAAHVGYSALSAEGEHARRVIAMRRGENIIGIATRFWQRDGGLASTRLKLPPGEWTNLFTGKTGFQGTSEVTELLGVLPVAALVRSTNLAASNVEVGS